MIRTHSIFVPGALIFCAALAGCGGKSFIGGQSQTPGTGSVVLDVTDAPAANLSILSAEVTLTGATLNPGNVSMLANPATLELTRLQTDVAYLGTTPVNAGNYTSITLTFANPMLTFENDTGGAISGAVCNGIICTIAPVATNLSTTITVPTVAIANGSDAGLLVDVNLNNLLSATLGVDFVNGTTVSQFTPAGTGAPTVGAEDVVGQVTSIATVHNTFSFQNSVGLFSLTVDSTSTFLNFPGTPCTTHSVTCLQDGQILSVDIGVRSDGTTVARNILFEDSNNTDIEVEGIVTGSNIAARTIGIVTLAESSLITGLKIGDPATVSYTGSTPFDIDFVHADNAAVDTTGYLFGAPGDLFVGQQIQVRRNPTGSSGNLIIADRVRLRSSRLTGTIQSLPSPFIKVGGVSPAFPSFFITRGITQIQALTSPPTIFTGNNIVSFTQLPVGNSISVRGPLFSNAGSPVVVASKVVAH